MRATFKVLFVFILLILSITFLSADEKYVLKSGEVFYGEKIEETDTTLIIKDEESKLNIILQKQKISLIEPVGIKIKTKNGFVIQGYIVKKGKDYLTIEVPNKVTVEV